MRYDASAVPAALNPLLTPELGQQVSFFLKWGYLVVEEAVTTEQVETLRSALDDTVKRREEQFTHELLEEDDRFAFLVDNPPVLRRITAILGNCVQLHSATARVTGPDTPDQDWHRDGPWPVDPDGTPIGSTPAQINCGYYLDELTKTGERPDCDRAGQPARPVPVAERASGIPGSTAGDGETRPGGTVQRLDLSPRGSEPFRPHAPRMPDVLPERLDEVARAVQWTTGHQVARARHAGAETAVGGGAELVTVRASASTGRKLPAQLPGGTQYRPLLIHERRHRNTTDGVLGGRFTAHERTNDLIVVFRAWYSGIEY